MCKLKQNKLFHNCFVDPQNDDPSVEYTLFSVRNIVSSPIQNLEKAMTKKKVNCCNNYSYTDRKEQATHAFY